MNETDLIAIVKISDYFIKKRLRYFFKIFQCTIGNHEYENCIFAFKVAFKVESLMDCHH